MSTKELLTKLLDYIEEQAKEIDPRAFRLGNIRDFLKSRGDLVGLPGVSFDINVEGDHLWLRVDRLEAHRPPPLDHRAKGLIRVSDDPDGQPPAIDHAAVGARLAQASRGKGSDETMELELRLQSDLEQSLASYSLLWNAWSEGERQRRRTIQLYGQLFAIKHQLEAEETASPTELLWGVGVATWKLKWQESADQVTEVDFEFPLLTQQMEIGFDEATMALCLRPRATNTRYEGDAFASCLVRGAADVERAVRKQLERDQEHPVTPFDPGSYTAVLRLVAGNLDSQGVYYCHGFANGDALPPPGEHLAVTDAWVLFVRPRSNNYLIEDLHRLKAKLEGGCHIPLGPGALVTPPAVESVTFEPIQFRGLSSRGSGNPEHLKELYFPLPYNQEQVTIVQQLEDAEGVTVQGPPGTGKTHTIANIICHYLATGRRILVTSKGEPALEVLQSKIPAEVRPLTVALLTSDRESLRQFESAINTIQGRVSQLNPELTRQEIAGYKSRIDRAHAELAAIDKRVDEIAVAQLAEFEIDGQPMRAQKLADLVVSGRERHGWFDDSLSLGPEHAPPLSDDEAGRLREVRRALGPDLAYVDARICAADDLPPPEGVGELHKVLVEMREIDEKVGSGAVLALRAASPEVLDAARDLLAAIDTARGLLTELDELGAAWALQLRARCRLASFQSERHALEALFKEMDALTESRAAFLQRPVEIPDEALESAGVREVVARAAETGKPFGFISFGNTEVKQLVGQVTVTGLAPASAADWAHVKRYVDLQVRVTSFVARWNQFAPLLAAPMLRAGASELRLIETTASAARKAHWLATHHDVVLVQRAELVFAKVPVKELNGNAEDLAAVRASLMSHLTKADLSRAATQLSTLKAKLAGTSGPVSSGLAAFVSKVLGKPGLAAERVAADYARLLQELRRIQALNTELSFVREAAGRFEKAGAPKFAARIRSVAVARGEDSAFPASWREAWSWARMKGHLETIEAREELLDLAERRRDLEQGLARLYKDMVGRAAWLETKRNASPAVLQALQGYATAIRRIGQGTGPNATRYRRDARSHMTSAASAVPCWIMSHAKISESMPADIGAFDLVIVDEASQSDLWALPAILRGKKILVVGDDKQVSPDGGFIAAQRIQELRDRFLGDQPYKEAMTPEKSLYDLAARVFAANHVMLREHFRCVPAIIAYSNGVFYKGAIQPLRIPKGTERIDPPLVDIYVEDGVRGRGSLNAREADVIADEIGALLANPRFAGRTIGVVSLLGMDQAKSIDERVRRRFSAAELLRRRFECGDARTFQGSERDIMFISVVVDPNDCKALAGNMFEQRFNVAASRARDRMYLVRSVKASDLSERDLRRTLLHHFDKPLVVDREQAALLIDRCESGFERQVYSALVEKGYRVTPQVETGAYRIDMVVEGAGDLRLAIECDGDEFHGPDRWSYDMLRQRILERAGWTFWRCFAATWLLRKDEVLGELIARLGEMGIEPLGAMDRAPQLVDKRVIPALVPEVQPAQAPAEPAAVPLASAG